LPVGADSDRPAAVVHGAVMVTAQQDEVS